MVFLPGLPNSYKQYKVFDDAFTKWLYGEYDENKLAQFEMMYHLPFIKDYMDYKLDLRADQEYLKRYGMTYADVHDPRKLKQVGSGSRMYGAGFDMVSKNVGRLYK